MKKIECSFLLLIIMLLLFAVLPVSGTAEMDSLQIDLVSGDVYAPVKVDVDLHSLYTYKAFITVIPEMEYDCIFTDENGEEDRVTDDCILREGYSFTALRPGDFTILVHVYVYNNEESKWPDNEEKSFPITVHASDQYKTAEVLGDAPLSLWQRRMMEDELERLKGEIPAEVKNQFVSVIENVPYRYEVNNQQIKILKVGRLAKEVIIPSEIDGYPVTCIGMYAFDSMEINSVVIPDSVESIEEHAFLHTANLKKIILPSSLTLEKIGYRAFFGVGIEDLILEDGTSLMSVSAKAYAKEGRLSQGIVFVSGKDWATYLIREDGGAVIVEGTEYYLTRDMGKIWTIPAEINGHRIQKIDDYAFSSCKKVETLILPEGLEMIGEGAFNKCENLKEVQLPSSLKSIGSLAFAHIAAEHIEIPDSVTDVALDWFIETDNTGKWSYYRNRDGTVSIIGYIPESTIKFPAEVDGLTVTGIQASVDYFDKNQVKKIVLPDTIESIGEKAFLFMENLSQINLPEGLITIGEKAFNSTNLKTVTIPSSVQEIGEYAFGWCESLSKVIIKGELTVIRKGQFFGCEKLSSIKLPSTLIEIEDEAFAQCWKLSSISLPENLEIIGYHAFYGHRMKEITIPSSVRTIGAGALWPHLNLAKLKVTIKNPAVILSGEIFGEYDLWRITLICYQGSTADLMYENVKKKYLK